MARRYRTQNTPTEDAHLVVRPLPWKPVLSIFLIAAIIIPAYLYGTRLGGNLLSTTTQFAADILNPHPSPTPLPVPTYARALPQAGSLLYTVQDGDSCVGFLAYQMRMNDAGTIFSDVKPETVKALNSVLGQDCHRIQPGMVLPLSPQYPLVALGGQVLKITSATPQQVIPTPLINVPSTDNAADCSGGCLFTVRVSPSTEVLLSVQTQLAVHIGDWVWAQAMLARKTVPGFANYPYADPKASLNGMTLHTCDFQVNNVHDNDSLFCDQLEPNTIDDDGGSWLFGVAGPSALDHWKYKLPVPVGTRVLLWLTEQHGQLTYRPGNPAYRYDEAKQLYVKM
ncbi:MAG TPA: hypothetical protein VGN34_26465 [Ktedonobacteraceae bacterium]|jgi:hypothetical protein